MTLLEAREAGRSAAEPGERCLRVVRRDRDWIAVIDTGRVLVLADDHAAPGELCDADVRRIVRHEVVGHL